MWSESADYEDVYCGCWWGLRTDAQNEERTFGGWGAKNALNLCRRGTAENARLTLRTK